LITPRWGVSKDHVSKGEEDTYHHCTSHVTGSCTIPLTLTMIKRSLHLIRDTTNPELIRVAIDIWVVKWLFASGDGWQRIQCCHCWSLVLWCHTLCSFDGLVSIWKHKSCSAGNWFKIFTRLVIISHWVNTMSCTDLQKWFQVSKLVVCWCSQIDQKNTRSQSKDHKWKPYVRGIC